MPLALVARSSRTYSNAYDKAEYKLLAANDACHTDTWLGGPGNAQIPSLLGPPWVF